MHKIIISDTSCLIALSNINLLNILKDLYQEIIITKEVHE
jgi:predicted nucleic acid-binding protein